MNSIQMSASGHTDLLLLSCNIVVDCVLVCAHAHRFIPEHVLK